MFDEIIESFTQKTMHKSANTVKKEVKKKVDEATTGANGQKLLIGALAVSAISLIFSLRASSRPVIVNVYNQIPPSQK